MNCGVGHRRGSDPSLLWLWCRLTAIPPMGPLAWKPPYVAGVAPEKAKKKKKKEREIAFSLLMGSRDGPRLT